MVASIGTLASAAQGASYYERDGYYAKDDPEHRAASAWFGKGAEDLGLKGPVDPEAFRSVLEGKVPDGSGRQLGKRGKDGEISHRPGRDLTFSAPKSVSLAALIGGDARIVEAHDRAVAAALAWVEKNVAETRLRDPETGQITRAGNQRTIAGTFRHDTSRNLDPQLHTHAVLANMVKGGGRQVAGPWPTRGSTTRRCCSAPCTAASWRADSGGSATASRRPTPTAVSRSRGCPARSWKPFRNGAPRSRRPWTPAVWVPRRRTSVLPSAPR